MNLEELNLSENLLELPEEQRLIVYGATATASEVQAYMGQRFGVPGSLLLLCNAIRPFALPGLSGIPLLPSLSYPTRSRSVFLRHLTLVPRPYSPLRPPLLHFFGGQK